VSDRLLMNESFILEDRQVFSVKSSFGADSEYGALVGWRWEGKPEVLG
jgi:hypothetical protein